MKIAIMGAGSVGGYYGGILKKVGLDVTLICRGKHREAITSRGLILKSHWGDFNIMIPSEEDPKNIGKVDLIIFTPKLYSNYIAIPQMEPLVHSKTIIITIQNGVSSHKQLSDYFGIDKVIPAATYIESEILEPGVIQQKGPTAIIEIGEINREHSDRLNKIHSLLTSKYLKILISEDIILSLWNKMISIGSVGTIMTSFRSSFIEVMKLQNGEEILRGTMREIFNVGRSIGVNLDENIIEEKINDLKKEGDAITASLQTDFTNNKPLEIDFILGYVVNLAKEKGIDCPYSTTLVASLDRYKKGTVNEQNP